MTTLRATSGWSVMSHLRFAMRLLLRPMPRHFSRWGAKRDAAISLLQFGHSHSLFFHWLYTWPNMSNPGWSTISGKGTVGQCSVFKGWWGGCQSTAAIFKLTKLLHALLVRLIQEEITLFDSTMHLKAKTKTGVVHQLRVNVMDQSLVYQKSKHTHRWDCKEFEKYPFDAKSYLKPTSSLVLSGPDRGISSIFIWKTVWEILTAKQGDVDLQGSHWKQKNTMTLQ